MASMACQAALRMSEQAYRTSNSDTTKARLRCLRREILNIDKRFKNLTPQDQNNTSRCNNMTTPSKEEARHLKMRCKITAAERCHRSSTARDPMKCTGYQVFKWWGILRYSSCQTVCSSHNTQVLQLLLVCMGCCTGNIRIQTVM